MKIIHFTFLQWFFVFVLLLEFTNSQAETPAKVIAQLMEELRQKGSTEVDKSSLFEPENQEKALNTLSKYVKDAEEVVALEALHLTAAIGSKANSQTLSKKAVETLAEAACSSKANVSLKALTSLRKFSKEDFSQDALRFLQMGLSAHHPHAGQLAKVAAFTADASFIPLLKGLYQHPELSKNQKKAIKLALLRLGDAALEAQFVAGLRQQKAGDDFVYDVLPEAVYTRSSLVFDYLFELILSEEKSCSAASNDYPEPIVCAYRIIEAIAPFVKDFPVQTDASGELKTDDYPQMLQTVRTWIRDHKNGYELKTEIY